MLSESGFLAALLVGLFGGVHCIGMCGGIVGALGLSLPESGRARLAAQLPWLLAYNLGRIASYCLAGALLGGIGGLAAHWAGLREAQLLLQLLAGLMMLALGLYLGGWWLGLTHIERAGGRLWQRLEPLGRRLLPVRSWPQALLLGLVWGWLPCGLVYSVLIWAIAAGSAAQGALLMLGFGLGTLPALLVMGSLAARLGTLLRSPPARRLAGGLVLGFGIYATGLALAGLARSLSG
ncbi:sulfite exporter TauE/SafE family protein [Thiohalobacter sp. IOR34]|uniref:sulfite exporter TauE/SafE family protein n=1 Tax=Thiohalobacter sp. IOR34 TaxID=3057176 RepID=UPI0025B1FA7A|nr:sulfite exporter TauE/SafE family protein [Thiohalobacter sp. IOR34]WJW75773.1 sulfite exporter TauE/SafE family protein [Thiohalobacter sp. IOR34]